MNREQDRRAIPLAILAIIVLCLSCVYTIGNARIEFVCGELVGSYEFTTVDGYAFCIDKTNATLVETGIKWTR